MYNNYPQNSVYESQTSVPFTQPTYANQYEPIQYTQNLPMNQPSQPIYDSAPSQSSIYSVPTQQQNVSYPQYVDNTYMNQQSQPTYQTVPQQPPPSYASAVQSSYPASVQQQPIQNNYPSKKFILFLYE
jgi:hypothetical protein